MSPRRWSTCVVGQAATSPEPPWWWTRGSWLSSARGSLSHLALPPWDTVAAQVSKGEELSQLREISCIHEGGLDSEVRHGGHSVFRLIGAQDSTMNRR